MAFAVTNKDNRLVLVESDVIKDTLLLGHDGLHTDGIVLVDTEVINVDSPLDGDGSEHSGGVGGPGHIPNLGAKGINLELAAECPRLANLLSLPLLQPPCYIK